MTTVAYTDYRPAARSFLSPLCECVKHGGRYPIIRQAGHQGRTERGREIDIRDHTVRQQTRNCQRDTPMSVLSPQLTGLCHRCRQMVPLRTDSSAANISEPPVLVTENKVYRILIFPYSGARLPPLRKRRCRGCTRDAFPATKEVLAWFKELNWQGNRWPNSRPY